MTELTSFWEASLGGAPAPRPALPGDVDADVCIVGAGYTGLWTAWALAGFEPALRIVVVEAEHVGFGASGRNGGWLSGLLPGNRSRQAAGKSGRDGVVRLQRQLIDAVSDVIKVCAEEGIEADIHHGGTLAVATNRAQVARLRASLQEDRCWGLGDEDTRELNAGEVRERIAIPSALGGLYSPHCARIQPAKLVRGLADAVSRRGVQIYERTPVINLAARRVRTIRGTVDAPWVVRATEGFTAGLPGLRRLLLPVNSSMIVTEPLSQRVWDRLGWEGRETLRDVAHVYVYAQRTADDRIAIGGRGDPYRFASGLNPSGATADSTTRELMASLRRLLPDVRDVSVAQSWSGVLGVARDWCPTIGVERQGDGGLAWAGGYIGDGVTASHLAGLTLADLILGRESSRTSLPWVGHRGRSWEPEPFRWFGAQLVNRLYRVADLRETRASSIPGRSGWAAVGDWISGRH